MQFLIIFYHFCYQVLGFLTLAGGFLDHAYAGDSSDSQVFCHLNIDSEKVML